MPIGEKNFAAFESVLHRLVEKFGRNLAELKGRGYDEAKLRLEFIDPLFDALGWDMKNEAGLILTRREVEIESRADAGRADYLFRIDRRPRFVCEAKKPAEELHGHAQQAKGYAWTIGVPLALLTDFEELNIYIVGSEPKKDEPKVGLWRTYSFRDFPARARELWDLLARDNVAGGIIDRTVQALPKKRFKIGTDQWIIPPSPTENFDAKFLNFLDGERRALASDLMRRNDRADLLEGTRLNEAVQCVLDRLIFIRISEARGIDMGTKLESLLETWRKRRARALGDALREEPPAHWGAAGLAAPRDSLWHSVVRHIRALDRRPPSHVPFFNGNLFKLHFSEELIVGDEWLEEFLHKICRDFASYKFGYIAVEILGTIYERFLGKIVRPHGRGAVIEEKPEVRKAGGVYYTPRYIVEYIVEQTVGKLLDEIAGPAPPPLRGERVGERGESLPVPSAREFERRTLALRFLDPACGSGSFLLRVFERICEHWLQWLTNHPDQQKKDWCWVEANTHTVHLTTRLKRRILRETVYGVDLDPQAVEVTQLSLYLKMLEGETRETLEREQDLFGGDEAILPPLQDNIKCGNSLIASDFSMLPADLVRVRAFDWPVQFAAIMKAGGFDAVVGNPPYIRIQTMQESDPQSVEFLKKRYAAAGKGNYDIYVVFVERGLELLKATGQLGFILPNKFFNSHYGEGLREKLSSGNHLSHIVHFGHEQVFDGATTYTCLLFLSKSRSERCSLVLVKNLNQWRDYKVGDVGTMSADSFGSTAWNLAVGFKADLRTKLLSLGKPLREVADIFVGLQTSADRVFVLEEASLVESRILKPFLTTGGLQPYAAAEPSSWLIFPYELHDDKAVLLEPKQFQSRFPKAWAYLKQHEKALRSRDGGKWNHDGWYAFGRSQNLTEMSEPKLVIQVTAARPTVILDENGLCMTGGGAGPFYGIRPLPESKLSLRFLLGILNSKFFGWVVHGQSTPLRGGYFKYSKQYIESVPIPAADKSRHDKLVLLVEKLLALTPKLRTAKSPSDKATLQNAVTATDQQIDALVYELYGLSNEEIKLVEGNA